MDTRIDAERDYKSSAGGGLATLQRCLHGGVCIDVSALICMYGIACTAVCARKCLHGGACTEGPARQCVRGRICAERSARRRLHEGHGTQNVEKQHHNHRPGTGDPCVLVRTRGVPRISLDTCVQKRRTGNGERKKNYQSLI